MYSILELFCKKILNVLAMSQPGRVVYTRTELGLNVLIKSAFFCCCYYYCCWVLLLNWKKPSIVITRTVCSIRPGE